MRCAKPLHQSGLTNSGVPDYDGIVLGAPGEDLHNPVDLGIASDDRVQFAGACFGGQVFAVLLQRSVLTLGARVGNAR